MSTACELHSQGWGTWSPDVSGSLCWQSSPGPPWVGTMVTRCGVTFRANSLNLSPSLPLTHTAGMAPGSQPPPPLKAARPQNQTHHSKAPISMAATLAHILLWFSWPQGKGEPQVLWSNSLCDLVPTCFSELFLHTLACPPLVCTCISHLCPLCVLLRSLPLSSPG